MNDDLSNIGTKYFGPQAAKREPIAPPLIGESRADWAGEIKVWTGEQWIEPKKYASQMLWQAVPGWAKTVIAIGLALLFYALVGGASPFGPN